MLTNPKWLMKRWYKRLRVSYLIHRDGQVCRYCTCDIHRITRHNKKLNYIPQSSWSRRLTIDHLVPRSKGGTNKLRNLGLACSSCNARKSSMSEQEYIRTPRLIKRRNSMIRERLENAEADRRS